MRFHKYWVREKVSAEPPGAARHFEIEVCGGSDESLDDARSQARKIADRVFKAISAGREPGRRYAYSDRPFREEILEEIRDGNELLAVVTRNSYGSRILNTAHAMFIDIDMDRGDDPKTGRPLGTHPWFVPAQENREVGLLARIKRAVGGNRQERQDGGFQAALSRIEETAHQIPDLALRVYRTLAGYRCLVTSRTVDPATAESQALLRRFECDPLYVKLCEVQECYRARLSPKYWRCGGQGPPSRFPFRDRGDEKRYRQWERRYEEEVKDFVTCKLVGTFGSRTVDPAIRSIVELHDRFSCGDSERLA